MNTSLAPVNRVARFTLRDDNVIDPASEAVLLDNIPSPGGGHNAGDLGFGKDGYLYVSVGDGYCDYAGDSGCAANNDAARPARAARKDSPHNAERGNPGGQPWRGTDSARCNISGRTTPGKRCQETWAWGLRNPFRFAFDPTAIGTRIFINDVGERTWEEIDLGQPGADYGWNVREAPCGQGIGRGLWIPPPGMTDPIYAYLHGQGDGCVR